MDEAKALGHAVKPVVIGPLTYLWLGKTKGADFDKLELVDRLLPLYDQIFNRLAAQGVEWVQIDEPILALDLPQDWKNAYERVYNILQRAPLKKLVTTYFGGLEDNLGLAANLPVDGLHIDRCGRRSSSRPSSTACRPTRSSPGRGQRPQCVALRPDKALDVLRYAAERLGDRLWVAPSCSLLHSPVDLAREDQLDAELKSWLAFAVQKCQEVALLAKAINTPEADEVIAALAQSRAVQASRATSPRIHKPAVQARVAAIQPRTASVSRPSRSASPSSGRGSICRRFPPRPLARSHRLLRSAWRARRSSRAR